MDNQHIDKISGYRELSQDELDLMNEIKSVGIDICDLLQRLRSTHEVDKRLVSIGATDLRTGLRALTRAVSKPERAV